jgi:site-specific DNA-methyltransferase (adenine-specific)
MKLYYEEAGITIYHGDCREVLPVIDAVDLVLTDPPYGVGLKGKRTKRAASLTNTGYSGAFEDTPEYVKAAVIPVIHRCLEISKRMVVTPGTQNLSLYPPTAAIGDFFNPAGAGMCAWGFNCSTLILYYGKDPFLEDGRGPQPNGQWGTAAGKGNKGHPCPKPLQWMKWLVNRASRPGEMILDPFMGSGTTLRAAKDEGRRAIGIEIEERYCELAVRELQQEVLPLEEMCRAGARSDAA